MNHKSKKNSMILHFKKRFYERFEYNITNDDIKKLVSIVKNDKEKSHYITQSLNKSIHILTLNNITFCAVYSKKYKVFYTCFPVEWLNENYIEY